MILYSALTCCRRLSTNKDVYRPDLYLFYLLVYLRHNEDALYKNYVDVADIRAK